jgi:predicted Zn-dependent protease
MAQLLFVLRQGAHLVRAVLDLAGHQLALAGAAGAVLAAVGQADAGADGGGEDGFAGVAGELAAAGLDCDLKLIQFCFWINLD